MIPMHDVEVEYGENCDGLYIKKTQHIPQSLLDGLTDDRLASSHVRAGEMHKVASIPAFCIELWIRQGKDPYRASPQELLQWLRQDDLNGFIATTKVI